jgi:hypothetical protein
MFGLALLARAAFAAQMAAAPTPDAQNGRVIVRLVSRNNDVSVLSTSAGVRYSAVDKAGRTLVSNSTLDGLKAEHPEIHRLLDASIATGLLLDRD